MRKNYLFSPKIFVLSLLIGVAIFSVVTSQVSATYGNIEIITPQDGNLIDITQDMPVTIFVNADPGVFKAIYRITSTSPADPHTQIYNWGYPIDYGYLNLPAYKKENLQYACQNHPGQTVYFIVDVNQCINPVDLQPGQTCHNWNSFEDTITLRCPTPPQCQITSFTASPNSVNTGGSSVLSWSTQNCNSCTASANPSNSYWYGNQSVSGSRTIYNLTQTTTFTLSCSGNYGSDQKTTTVTVSTPPPPPPTPRYACNTNTWQCYETSSGPYTSLSSCEANCQPPINPPTVTLTANPSVINQGESSVLSWSSTNATTCLASGGWSGNKSLSGNETVAPPVTTTYSITCTGAGGSATDSATVTVNTPPQNFDFSLSNSGDITVTKPLSGSVTASNTITVTLLSGTPSSVNLQQSGLPSGVTAADLFSCNPTCTKTNTLTISSSAPVGTFPITITGTGGGLTRTTNYNLIIQQSTTPLSVSCSASPNPAQVNQTVGFYSSVSGGSGSYYYSWSGAASGNSPNYYRSFASSGTYTAYLTVSDNAGHSASTSCSVTVSSRPSPTLTFWADKYTLYQGESTYLRWNASYVSTCTASNGWSGSKSISGYEMATPTSDTSYTLTCSGPYGSVEKTLTLYVITTTGHNLSLVKLGRNLSAGDRIYSKTIRLTPGDVAEFYLTVTASHKDLTNVIIKDTLPTGLRYMTGTTKINGIVQPDTLTTTGLHLGNLNKDESVVITFQALSLNPGLYLSQTNTAEVSADNEESVSDNATITFGLVAGAATVRTGPADTLKIIFLISTILSLILWYYLSYNPRGKLLLIKVQDKIRNYNLERLRRHLK